MTSNSDGEDRGRFDHFAESASAAYGRSVAFILAITLVVAWALLGPVMHFTDTWHLVINTPTTIVTFLGLFLLQNSQRRFENAVNCRLNAMAAGLADLMDHIAGGDNDDEARDQLLRDAAELRQSVGAEERAGA